MKKILPIPSGGPFDRKNMTVNEKIEAVLGDSENSFLMLDSATGVELTDAEKLDFVRRSIREIVENKDKQLIEEVADILWAANEELFRDHEHAEMASILSKAIKDALDKIEGED